MTFSDPVNMIDMFNSCYKIDSVSLRYNMDFFRSSNNINFFGS